MENNNVIIKAVNYIENHLNDKLTLEEIANKMSYSKFHINRLFYESVGCTIYQYIQRRRLTEAAKKLVYTNEPISDIAYGANYNSQQSFTLAFRQLYYYTPQAYRLTGNFAPKQNRFTSSISMLKNNKIKYEAAA